MEDNILQMFFDHERWVKAIDKGVGKDINRAQLIKLCTEDVRIRMAHAMKVGKYEIAPPHTALIPKENGEFRTVYVNEPIDRIVLSIANDLLFDLMPEMLHPSCKSYQTGMGCGKIVKEASRCIANAAEGEVIGWKSDLSKYFDSVPIRYIDGAFDFVEWKYGKSALIEVLRKYYHSDLYFNTDGKLCRKYQSLKQGCAVASWLANVVLFHVDAQLSGLKGFYVRYSDDMLYIGSDYEEAMQIVVSELSEMDMKLNPKKVEYLSNDKWFKFLGYAVKGRMISLSKKWIKHFQNEIEERTIRKRGVSVARAIGNVNRYLYKGNGEFSWATSVLTTVNVDRDLDELNKFVMDCIRAVQTGKHKVGGLGYVDTMADGCIVRGRGKNVRANRMKSGAIEGYLSIGCMANAIRTRRAVYDTLVASL